MDIRANTAAPAGVMFRGIDPCSKVEDELDRALLGCVARRDQAAFDRLHSRYRQRIARFVSRRTARPEMVEEITNDTLWVVWRSASSFRGGSKVSTWILGIAHRVSFRAFRNQVNHADGVAMPEYHGEDAHEPRLNDEALEWLASALSQLPPAQRTALELAYLLGHSCEEIAERMHCPVNTVKTRLFHGRRKMRLLLARLGAE